MEFDRLVETLRKRGFKARYYENIEQVNRVLMQEIGPEQSVGIGGSVTVNESGLPDLLKDRGNRVYFHWKVDKSKSNETRKLASQADVYLTSSNAVTMDGKLVNIDGYGNRVASMFYGPDRVYIICGKNKIVEDEKQAVDRIKTVTCPRNAERLNRNTPCRKTGVCHDCSAADRMCNIKVVLDYCPIGKDVNIMLVNQELGY